MFAGFYGFVYCAGTLTDTGMEDIKTFLTDCLLSGNTGNFFSGAVKRSNVFFKVNSKDPVSNTIQNGLKLVILFFHDCSFISFYVQPEYNYNAFLQHIAI